MAEAQDTTITTPAASAAPVADTAPITPSASTDAVVTPVESAPVTESVAPASEPAKAEIPTPPLSESILGDEAAKASEKKDTVVEAKDAKVETPTETKVELPTYEEFKLPENVQLDKEPLDAFSKLLGEIETGKLDHAGMQAKGQALIDLAAKATSDSINRLNDYYVQFHENQKKEWFESFKKDPDMGGEKLNETVGMLREAVDQYAGSPEQVKEFRQLMKETGVGNHPALTRVLYNMQKKIDSYTKETSNRAVPAQAPAPSKVKPYQQFYQGNG